MICFVVYKLQPVALHLLVEKVFFLLAEVPEMCCFLFSVDFFPCRLGEKSVRACVENSNPN